MENKQSIKERIILISNELRISKDGENTYSKYAYFTPDGIMRVLNPLLQKHRLITFFNLKFKETYFEAILDIQDLDSPDNIRYQFDILKATVKGANEAQNSGATLTYGKRYLLMNIFNIADNSMDFDSNEMTEKQSKNLKTDDFLDEKKTKPEPKTLEPKEEKPDRTFEEFKEELKKLKTEKEITTHYKEIVTTAVYGFFTADQKNELVRVRQDCITELMTPTKSTSTKKINALEL